MVRGFDHGAYYDDDFGTWFYMPKPLLRHRARAAWYFHRLALSAWLARRFPRTFNPNRDMF